MMEGEIWRCPLESTWLLFILWLMKIYAMDVELALASAQQTHYRWRAYLLLLNNSSAHIANYAFLVAQLMPY